MDLTPEQQLEMYSAIKVIEAHCTVSDELFEKHDQRIGVLERSFWIFTGICTAMTLGYPLLLDHFYIK